MIYADRIAANAITADKIVTNTITAAHMDVSSMEVDGTANILNIKAGLIYSLAIAGTVPTSPLDQRDSRLTGALNYFELDHPTAGVKFRLGSATKYLYFDGDNIYLKSVDVELTTADVITYWTDTAPNPDVVYRLRHTGLSLICDLTAEPNTQKGAIVFDAVNSIIKFYGGANNLAFLDSSTGLYITSISASDSATMAFSINGSTTYKSAISAVGSANAWFTGTALNDMSWRIDNNSFLWIGFRVSSVNYVAIKMGYLLTAFYTTVLCLDSTGKVGIGTASPASALQIVQAATTNLGLRIGQDLTNYYSIGRNNSDGYLEINGVQTTNSGFRFITPAGTVATIGNAGNVTMVGFATDSNANAALGLVGSALATSATTGHGYIPTCAGTPSGVPTTITGKQALIVDTTNDIFYRYTTGWKVISASGSYTPTITNVNNTNTGTSIPRTAYWIRIGNQVFVHGQITIFANGAGRVTFKIDLPVSITTSSYSISGTAVDPNNPAVMSIKDLSTSAIFDNLIGWGNTGAANFSYTFGYYVQ